jgi:hypothetical protein
MRTMMFADYGPPELLQSAEAERPFRHRTSS